MSGEVSQDLLSQSMLGAAEGVLGAMLIDDATVGPVLMVLEDTDFLVPEHRRIFRAFRQRYSAGKPVDSMLIAEDLPPDYRELLAKLMEVTPTAQNAKVYAEELREKSRLWQLQQVGEEISHVPDLDQGRQLVDRGNLLLCERTGIRRVTMDRAAREFLPRRDGTGKVDRIRWGISDLDEHLYVEPGDMVVIGGYSSAGKTAFALQMAYDIARSKRVGIYSYETAADKLADRIIACQTGTSFSRIMGNRLDREDYARIKDMLPRIAKTSLDLLETSGMTVSDIGACAMAYRHDVIVVDYLQKIPARPGRPQNDYERVSQVSSDLQQLGRTTGKIVIALSQLSRPERRKDNSVPPPNMSSLRQSGQIEQDADVVLLLYKEHPDQYVSKRCLDIAKNKDGVAGLGLLLDFDGDQQRFRKAPFQPLTPRPPAEDVPQQDSLFRPLPDRGPTPFDTEVHGT